MKKNIKSEKSCIGIKIDLNLTEFNYRISSNKCFSQNKCPS